jgi:adenine deaminase
LSDLGGAYRAIAGPDALAHPFMAMSFLSLEVIGDLKLTDKGLVDVTAFTPVDCFVND